MRTQQSGTVPFIGFSNATLARCPELHAGEIVICEICKMPHVVKAFGSNNSPETLLAYRCDQTGSDYLCGVGSKNVMGVKADASGETSADWANDDQPEKREATQESGGDNALNEFLSRFGSIPHGPESA